MVLLTRSEAAYPCHQEHWQDHKGHEDGGCIKDEERSGSCGDFPWHRGPLHSPLWRPPGYGASHQAAILLAKIVGNQRLIGVPCISPTCSHLCTQDCDRGHHLRPWSVRWSELQHLQVHADAAAHEQRCWYVWHMGWHGHACRQRCHALNPHCALATCSRGLASSGCVHR